MRRNITDFHLFTLCLFFLFLYRNRSHGRVSVVVCCCITNHPNLSGLFARRQLDVAQLGSSSGLTQLCRAPVVSGRSAGALLLGLAGHRWGNSWDDKAISPVLLQASQTHLCEGLPFPRRAPRHGHFPSLCLLVSHCCCGVARCISARGWTTDIPQRENRLEPLLQLFITEAKAAWWGAKSPRLGG